jgi:hypothetical protein
MRVLVTGHEGSVEWVMTRLPAKRSRAPVGDPDNRRTKRGLHEDRRSPQRYAPEGPPSVTDVRSQPVFRILASMSSPGSPPMLS